MAKNVSFVNIFGTYLATRADAMKDWTADLCEIKSVSVTDGFATALSPTVEMLTRKGTADGTCGGQKVGGTDIWGVSIFVKDSDAWNVRLWYEFSRDVTLIAATTSHSCGCFA
jgi:hypothetical protein